MKFCTTVSQSQIKEKLKLERYDSVDFPLRNRDLPTAIISLAEEISWQQRREIDIQASSSEPAAADSGMSMDIKENLFWGLVLKPDKR